MKIKTKIERIETVTKIFDSTIKVARSFAQGSAEDYSKVLEGHLALLKSSFNL